jgi:hypothetical protein
MLPACDAWASGYRAVGTKRRQLREVETDEDLQVYSCAVPGAFAEPVLQSIKTYAMDVDLLV